MQVSNHKLDKEIKPIVSYSLPACQTAHPTHHKWQTPQQKQRYSNCLKPTEMGKNKNRDRIWSSWSKSLFTGCAPVESSFSLSGVADGQDTYFLFALRTAHAARYAPGCTFISSLQYFLNEYPFTAYVRIRPKMFRKKLPSLYFFIYFTK